MNILVTGASGFIGKNLVLRLNEQDNIQVIQFVRGESELMLADAIKNADAIIHLAGENRPLIEAAFEEINVGLTHILCNTIRQLGSKVPLIFTSSAQVELDNPYGHSKLAAENLLCALSKSNGNPVAVYRLPGVFGKWCKPNYNSVVATFCHNIANDNPIQINDPKRLIKLVYVDDVISSFLSFLKEERSGIYYESVRPEYTITLAELAEQIVAFKDSRSSLISERVGIGFIRALYATYVSYLPKESFVYDVPAYADVRGVFVEMLKTPDAGQFSFFTAYPGVTRGGHYHHTKTEKFLVIKGKALFGFRHMVTNEKYFIETTGNKPQIVETVPGWTHDITNNGDEEMIVMLWANEIFDRNFPDTTSSRV